MIPASAIAREGSSAASREDFWGEEESVTKALSYELLLIIFSYMPNAMSLYGRCALVCRRWRAVSGDSSLFKQFVVAVDGGKSRWIIRAEAKKQVLCKIKDFFPLRGTVESMQKHEKDIYFVAYARNCLFRNLYRYNFIEKEYSSLPIFLPQEGPLQLIKNDHSLVIFTLAKTYLNIVEFSTHIPLLVSNEKAGFQAMLCVCSNDWLVCAYCSNFRDTFFCGATFSQLKEQGVSAFRPIGPIEGFRTVLPSVCMTLSCNNFLFINLGGMIAKYNLRNPEIAPVRINTEGYFPLAFHPREHQCSVDCRSIIIGNGQCIGPRSDYVDIHNPLDNMAPPLRVLMRGYSDCHIERIENVLIFCTSFETTMWDLVNPQNRRRLPFPRKRVLFTEIDGLSLLRGTADGVVEKWDFWRFAPTFVPMETRSAGKRQREIENLSSQI